jgi:hypothetical protein
MRGELLAHRGEVDRAIADFTRVIEINDPKMREARAANDHHPSEAIRWDDKLDVGKVILGAHGLENLYQAHQLRGRLYRRLGKQALADKDFVATEGDTYQAFVPMRWSVKPFRWCSQRCAQYLGELFWQPPPCKSFLDVQKRDATSV